MDPTLHPTSSFPTAMSHKWIVVDDSDPRIRYTEQGRTPSGDTGLLTKMDLFIIALCTAARSSDSFAFSFKGMPFFILHKDLEQVSYTSLQEHLSEYGVPLIFTGTIRVQSVVRCNSSTNPVPSGLLISAYRIICCVTYSR